MKRLSRRIWFQCTCITHRTSHSEKAMILFSLIITFLTHENTNLHFALFIFGSRDLSHVRDIILASVRLTEDSIRLQRPDRCSQVFYLPFLTYLLASAIPPRD